MKVRIIEKCGFYYPQFKFLWGWNPFSAKTNGYDGEYTDIISFNNLNDAKSFLNNYYEKQNTEYKKQLEKVVYEGEI